MTVRAARGVIYFAAFVAFALAASALVIKVTAPSGAAWFNYVYFDGCNNGHGGPVDMQYNYEGDQGTVAVKPGQVVTIDVGDNNAANYNFDNNIDNDLGGGSGYGLVDAPEACGESIAGD